MQIGECTAAHVGKTVTITQETWQIKGRLEKVTHGKKSTTELKVEIIVGRIPETIVDLSLDSNVECEID